MVCGVGEGSRQGLCHPPLSVYHGKGTSLGDTADAARAVTVACGVRPDGAVAGRPRWPAVALAVGP